MAFPSDLARTKNWGTETLTDADLESQIDLIINWIMASLDSSTGHDHDGTSNQGPKIPVNSLTVSSQAQGDILYASSASAWARLAKGTATQILKMNSGATAPEWVSGVLWSELPDGAVVQVVNTQSGAVATGTTVIPNDDTIPQNTEGDEYITRAITPKATTNKLKIDVVFVGSVDTNNDAFGVALFQDTTANALAFVPSTAMPSAGDMNTVSFTHYMAAGTTSSTTFKVRAGYITGTGTLTFNGSAGGRKAGGVIASSITITEIKAS